MGVLLVWSLTCFLLNIHLCKQTTVTHRVVLTLDPNWSEVFYGEAFTLRCEIQDGGNTGWTYEWTPSRLNSPTTTNEYRITRATTAQRGSYRCRGRTDSSVTTEWSNVIELTVADRPKTQLNMSTTSINQGSVTLTCSVSSSSGWKYYWYKDKSLYKPQYPQLYSDHPHITVPPGGTYQCRGGRGDPVYYSQYSNSVVMTRAVVTLKSNWSEIFHSETVTLRCEITDGGDTEWVYEWSASGPNLPQEQSEYLTIRVDFFSSRQYYCKGKHKEDENMETEWSNSMSLNASSPKPQAHLTSDTTSIQQGSSVTLTCSVRSSSGWRYYWYKDNTLYKPHTTQDFSDNPQISVSVGGGYRCRGGRGNPVYYTYHSHTVSISTIVSNVAVVTLDPNWSEIYTGEKITLRCEIHRADTEWEYEWRKSDTALSETESEIRITKAHSGHTGDYSCRGRMNQSQDHSTNWSHKVTLTVSVGKPSSVLTVSPSWLSPGASVTLKCHVKHPSAGWRFYWYKAVPHFSDELYRYELLPDSSEGTEQEDFTVHGQKTTTGYVCRAGRGDPQFYSEYSPPKFTWCGAMDSSVSLRVSPNRSQHFTSESVSLSCETNSTEWRVRQFYENSSSKCDNYLWRTQTSPCIVSRTVYSGAVFWCESGSGEFSNAVNISTHDDIILESPVHPVTEGQPLILSCRPWTDVILSDVTFYKNGKLIQTGTSGQLKISAVSKSDEGFYQCEIKEVKSQRVQVWMSSVSWVSVKSETVELAEDRSPFPVALIIGLVSGILLIMLLPLIALGWSKTSKDSWSHWDPIRVHPPPKLSTRMKTNYRSTPPFSTVISVSMNQYVVETLQMMNNTMNMKSSHLNIMVMQRMKTTVM
ncbi:uncharacterized protein LOC115438506 isoform X2 [Sphaeramia orbicularis]|uniref:uncharacterized protein LOC115438506 isoform X2 n=1 Tax=Sphaeramia orbicularis TaxID=375764 RepID=UPI0011812FD2|nr:uncharacterized protein LOC115438506 isoform X2 [Sphaeramia orbicularis]